jgi:hypothetical protein
MDSTSILILIAIVLLGIAVMGGGTMVFCCTGFERGLPFLSYRSLFEELETIEERTVARYRNFVSLVNEVTQHLQQDAAKIPSKILLREVSSITEMDSDLEDGKVAAVGCQTVPNQQIIPPVEVAITIPED